MTDNAPTDNAPADDDPITPDDRAAARAFVARAEVRLSTFHRIAVGMLSGAGLLVILPVVARDTVSGVMRTIMRGDVSGADAALAAAIAGVVAVPVIALVLLLTDLTRFYFHANHLGGAAGGLFTPRFTLTALQLASDELGAPSEVELERYRRDPRMLELLVPVNARSRRHVDLVLERYGLGECDDDVDRVAGLRQLAASTNRPLLEEVAKIEAGLVRHALRLRIIILRYVKALLSLLTTALAIFVADAIVADVAGGADLDTDRELALACTVLLWVPAVVVAVTAPVRWIEQNLRSDLSTGSAATRDPDLTHIERVTLRVAAVVGLAAITAIVLVLQSADVSTSATSWTIAAIGGSAIALVGSARRGHLGTLRSTDADAEAR